LDLSPIGEATPKWPREETPSAETTRSASSSKAEFCLGPLHQVPGATLPTLLENDLQVRNTFIHLQSNTPQGSGRSVQSMPHDMFRQCLEEEKRARAASEVTMTRSMTQPAARVEQPAADMDAMTIASSTCGGSVPASPEPAMLGGSVHASPEPAKAGEETQSQIFQAGDTVVIQGLTKIPAFNGQIGVVERFDEATSRYSVRLINATQGMPKTAKVKADNLQSAEVPQPVPQMTRPILGTPGKQLTGQAYFSPMRLGGC